MPQVAEPQDPFVGTAVGKYRLRERIGEGPHAVVYLAAPPSGDQPLMAFKLFSPEASADTEYSTRGFDSAEASRRITHAGIVRVLEVGRQENRGYLLMEHVPGGSLDKLLETERRLSFERATCIARDIAMALEAAHTAGLIHQNLRPTNILLGDDGRARITDFGQGWQPRLGRGLNPEDPIGGPVEYLSPEQVQGQLAEPGSDLYALGLLYYKMLTGKLPFPGVNDREVALNRVKGRPRPLREAFSGVDPRAIPIVEKLLAANPESRFGSARSFLAVIDPFVKGKTSKAYSRSSMPVAADVSVIPSEIRNRLSFASAAAHFGPGLALLAIAGTVARGGEGFFPAIGSFFTSTVSLSFGAAGLAGLAIGCFLLRKELKDSGRARVVLGLIAGSALFTLIGTAALDRSLWSGSIGVLVAPVNVLLAAAGLAWFGTARCYDQDENTVGMRGPKICLGLAAPFWFLGWAAGNILGPFKGMVASMETAAPLVLAASIAMAIGFVAVASASCRPRIRRMGVGLLGLAALAIAIWGVAGASGKLASPGSWPGALFSAAGHLATQIPRSGAPALLALGLIATADYVLRGGLIRHYAKAKK